MAKKNPLVAVPYTPMGIMLPAPKPSAYKQSQMAGKTPPAEDVNNVASLPPGNILPPNPTKRTYLDCFEALPGSHRAKDQNAT